MNTSTELGHLFYLISPALLIVGSVLLVDIWLRPVLTAFVEKKKTESLIAFFDTIEAEFKTIGTLSDVLKLTDIDINPESGIAFILTAVDAKRYRVGLYYVPGTNRLTAYISKEPDSPSHKNIYEKELVTTRAALKLPQVWLNETLSEMGQVFDTIYSR